MEFKITEKQLPAIKFNFEEVKNKLSEKLCDYKKLVVTEETLKFCKSEQKHLAGLRREVDTYRKDVKKELSKPLDEFESKCKEIVSLISETESKLKEGINYYDDLKKEENKKFAESEINRLKTELELPQELLWQVQLKKEYCNLTAKKKDVTKDITIQILSIKDANAKYLIDKQEIFDYIEKRNVEVKQKVDPKRYESLIESEGIECLKQIESDFNNIVQYEKELEEKSKIEVEQAKIRAEKEIEETKKKAEIETQREIEKAKIEIEKKVEDIKKESGAVKVEINEKTIQYKIQVEGTYNQLVALKEFMNKNNIKFEATKI